MSPRPAGSPFASTRFVSSIGTPAVSVFGSPSPSYGLEPTSSTGVSPCQVNAGNTTRIFDGWLEGAALATTGTAVRSPPDRRYRMYRPGPLRGSRTCNVTPAPEPFGSGLRALGSASD